MNMITLLAKCKKHGIKISRAKLYAQGKKYGFLKKHTSEYFYDLDIRKFQAWVTKMNEKIPEGYVNIQLADKILGMSYSKIYWLAIRADAKTLYIGTRKKGKMYVNIERIREIDEERKKERGKINIIEED